MNRDEAVIICPQLAKVRLNPPVPVEVPEFTDVWKERLIKWHREQENRDERQSKHD